MSDDKTGRDLGQPADPDLVPGYSVFGLHILQEMDVTLTFSELYVEQLPVASIILNIFCSNNLQIYYELYTVCRTEPCSTVILKIFCLNSLQMRY